MSYVSVLALSRSFFRSFSLSLSLLATTYSLIILPLTSRNTLNKNLYPFFPSLLCHPLLRLPLLCYTSNPLSPLYWMLKKGRASRDGTGRSSRWRSSLPLSLFPLLLG